MTEGQKDQLATMLGVTVGTLLDLGITTDQIARAFSKKNILAAAEVVGKKDSGRLLDGVQHDGYPIKER